ncbi:MAG: UDP-N-acetylmuramoyl-tripeptide--D-alanyl-D-alanine ligase [Anaerovorax sp.]
MSAFGEIDRLANMVRPDIGIITNIGTSHIENLGSREGILKAKLEMTNYFTPNEILCINTDNELLSKENCEGNYKLVRTGTTGRNEFIISNIMDFGERGIEFSVEHKEEIQAFKLLVPGRHNAFNAALAIGAAYQLGVTMAEAAAGLLKLELTDKRLSIKGKNGMKIIDDTYNASPDSMKSALDVLATTRGVRKIAILGDMLEMGVDSAAYHREIGVYAAHMKVDKLICIGKESKNMVAGALKTMKKEDVIYGEKKEKVYKQILDMAVMGDVILVKGSRGMAMDEIVKKIMEKE